jgi:hypothetical protein
VCHRRGRVWMAASRCTRSQVGALRSAPWNARWTSHTTTAFPSPQTKTSPRQPRFYEFQQQEPRPVSTLPQAETPPWWRSDIDPPPPSPLHIYACPSLTPHVIRAQFVPRSHLHMAQRVERHHHSIGPLAPAMGGGNHMLTSSFRPLSTPAAPHHMWSSF